ncbi:AraC family transcriptional regulator [Aeromicrobium sp. NPDC092404]|uniref:AraC family transcriptional regulator n=1 Tax=Aeromicrobium sp. NPDC092404 TaxID=3154976 RepID=UPI0034141267
MSSLIRATNLWGYTDLVRNLGGDPAILLACFDLPGDIEQDADAFVSFRSAAHLVETTAEELGCRDFALRLSRWQGLDVLGPIAVIARNERTVRDGLLAVARYLHIHSPALKLEVEPSGSGEDLNFTYEIIEPGLARLRQCYELSMANFARIVRLLAGPDTHLGRVSLMHDQIGPSESYADVLGCPIRFGEPRYAFQVPADLAAKPIDSADETTRRIATKYLESELRPVESALSENVAALARALLPIGHCTTEAIAEQLAMHPRTLQRRLADEGVRCQDIIDVERQRQAVRYLSEPRLYLGQVSRMLGFAEQSSLNRACLRWFGKTPRQYRADLTRT